MESPSLPNEQVAESVKVVSADDVEEIMTCPPRRRGVRFDPPLNLYSYVSIAPFPSKLAVAKGVA